MLGLPSCIYYVEKKNFDVWEVFLKADEIFILMYVVDDTEWRWLYRLRDLAVIHTGSVESGNSSATTESDSAMAMLLIEHGAFQPNFGRMVETFMQTASRLIGW